MAKTNAVPGFGALFLIGNGDSPETFQALAEVVDITGFGFTQMVADATHQLSPGGWVEKISLGLKEGKPFSVPVNFVADDAQQVTLIQTRASDGSKHNYQLQCTDVSQTTITFEAVITDVTINHPQRDKADASIEFTPSSAYVYAA